jgi:sugar lactone lactonase YvrE
VFRLGEGPFWDARRSRLLWVDILAGTVLEGHLDADAIQVTQRIQFDSMVSAVTVADDGGLLVAAQEHLVQVHRDGTRQAGLRIIPAGRHRRLNDGSTDPAGRFLVGTLSLDGPSEREQLVRLEADGTVTELDGDLTLSNGLAWSTDGSRLFSVDTLRQTIFVRDYDAVAGRVGERRPHVRLPVGFPDGIAMDAADHLWVAVWGGGEIRRYAPDGDLVERVAIPAPHTPHASLSPETTSGSSSSPRRRLNCPMPNCAHFPTQDASSPCVSMSPAAKCRPGPDPP